METKRCAYCRKLQRVESQECSRCGRPFERRRSRREMSWPGSASLFSLPAASPHHAGHYSGLHPEDQPYQSNIMFTPLYAAQLAQEEKDLQQEPRRIELPETQNAPVADSYPDSSSAPIHQQIPLRRSRLHPVIDQSLPEGPETYGMEGRDEPTEQVSQPFIQEVFTAIEQPQRAGVNPVPTFETQQPQKMQDVDWTLQASQFSSGDEPLSVPNDATLLVEDLPSYMREALHTRRWSARFTSTVVLVASFGILLATSVMVFVWMGTHAASGHSQQPSVIRHTPEILHTPEASASSLKPPHLQLPSTQANFGPSASGVVSSQTITLENSGGGQAVWQESSDQPWLTASSKSGTFTNSQNIQITVNRKNINPGDYTGHMAFWLQSQENTPAILTVTMTVTPIPAQLSVSTTSLSYSTAQSQVPESQAITISNTGGDSLHWDASVSHQGRGHWLRLSLLHGVLPPGKQQQITVQVASRTLPVGTYTGLISFTGNASAQVKVSLTVVAPGHLVISPPSLAFTAQQTTQTLSLQNSGSLPLDWTVKPTTNDQIKWLRVTSSTGGTLGPGESVTVAVHVDPSNLLPGTHQGVLTFSVGDQTTQVSVSFAITGTMPTPVPLPTSTPIVTPLPTKSVPVSIQEVRDGRTIIM